VSAPARAQARGGDWLAVASEGGTGGLPAWAADRASLLWLHVHAGAPARALRAPPGCCLAPVAAARQPRWRRPLPPERRRLATRPSAAGPAPCSMRSAHRLAARLSGHAAGAAPACLTAAPRAGAASSAPQAVRLEPAGARPAAGPTRRMSTDLGGGGGGGGAGQAGSVELDVSVEYEHGCQRSHVSRLAVPVLPPIRCAPRPGAHARRAVRLPALLTRRRHRSAATAGGQLPAADPRLPLVALLFSRSRTHLHGAQANPRVKRPHGPVFPHGRRQQAARAPSAAPARRVALTARELPGARVALQAALASQLPWPALLLSARLELQPGFAALPAAPALKALLPMRVRGWAPPAQRPRPAPARAR